jgi:hypothetical protein
MSLTKRSFLFACGLLGMAPLASAASGPTCAVQGDIFASLHSACTINQSEESGCAAGDSIRASAFLQDCFCKGQNFTPTYVGTGGNCAAADQSVFSQADGWVQHHACVGGNNDGLCYESNVIVTVACFFNAATGLYQESGHIVFKCLYCS